MENNIPKIQEIDLIDLAKKIWLERRRILRYVVAACIVGLVVAFSLPSEYKTTVKMVPEGGKINTGGEMSGLAAMAGINIGSASITEGINLNIYPDIVSSIPFMVNLSSISVHKRNDPTPITLYDYLESDLKSPWWSYLFSLPMKAVGFVAKLGEEKMPEFPDNYIDPYQLTSKQERVLQTLKDRVSIEIDTKAGMISVKSQMQDPVISAIVADSVVSRLERYIIEYRTNKAKQDYEFTLELYNDAKDKYYEAQQRYAQYQDKNQNVIRESVKIESARLFNEQQLTYTVYSSLTQKLELAKIKVQEQTPFVTIIDPARIPERKANMSKLKILMVFAFLGGFAAVTLIALREVIESVRKRSPEKTEPENQ